MRRMITNKQIEYIDELNDHIEHQPAFYPNSIEAAPFILTTDDIYIDDFVLEDQYAYVYLNYDGPALLNYPLAEGYEWGADNPGDVPYLSLGFGINLPETITTEQQLKAWIVENGVPAEYVDLDDYQLDEGIIDIWRGEDKVAFYGFSRAPHLSIDGFNLTVDLIVNKFSYPQFVFASNPENLSQGAISVITGEDAGSVTTYGQAEFWYTADDNIPMMVLNDEGALVHTNLVSKSRLYVTDMYGYLNSTIQCRDSINMNGKEVQNALLNKPKIREYSNAGTETWSNGDYHVVSANTLDTGRFYEFRVEFYGDDNWDLVANQFGTENAVYGNFVTYRYLVEYADENDDIHLGVLKVSGYLCNPTNVSNARKAQLTASLYDLATGNHIPLNSNVEEDGAPSVKIKFYTF